MQQQTSRKVGSATETHKATVRCIPLSKSFPEEKIYGRSPDGQYILGAMPSSIKKIAAVVAMQPDKTAKFLDYQDKILHDYDQCYLETLAPHARNSRAREAEFRAWTVSRLYLQETFQALTHCKLICRITKL